MLCLKINNGLLHRGNENQLSPFLFFPIFIHNSFFLHLSSKICPQLFKIESSYLVYRIRTRSCIVGWRTGFVLSVRPHIC